MASKRVIAVVTGASQGLGLETCRQLVERGMHVILTARSQDAVERGLAVLSAAGSFEGRVLDVASDRSVEQLFVWLAKEHGRIDILINNAGRIYGAFNATLAITGTDVIADAVDNNALGAWRMMRRALPMMNAAGHGRIVNVSSGMGALSDMGSGAIPYRVSKTALNALTILAAHEAQDDVKVNAVCPGWVRTDMGGASAPRSLGEGVSGIVWAATLPDDGPNGGFFRDGQPVDW